MSPSEDKLRVLAALRIHISDRYNKMVPRLLSATRGVMVCFPGRGEWRSHYPCVFMRGETHRSPNRSIFKPEYSGISCLFLKCNCDNKMDTFFRKFEVCDGQEMGVWRTKRRGSYQMIVSEVLILARLPQDFQFGFDRWSNWNNIKFHTVVNITTKIHHKNGGAGSVWAIWKRAHFP